MLLSIHIGFGDIVTLLIGFTVGASIAANIFLKQKRKKFLTHIEPKYIHIPSENKVFIEKYIQNINNYHALVRKEKITLLFGIIHLNRKVDYEGLSKNYLNQDLDENKKKLSLIDELLWLVENIAKESYPESDHPLYELSIDEILEFSQNIIYLIEDLIDDMGIPNVKRIKISLIISASNVGGKFIKIYNKPYVRIPVGIVNAAIKFQAVITPIYWIKKGSKKESNDSLMHFIMSLLFEVVGKETGVIYYNNVIKQQELLLLENKTDEDLTQEIKE